MTSRRGGVVMTEVADCIPPDSSINGGKSVMRTLLCMSAEFDFVGDGELSR